MEQKQAGSTLRPKNITLMYGEFTKAISVGDQGEARRLYRELLSAGQTSKELIDTAFLAVYEDGSAEAIDRSNDVLPNVGIRGDLSVLKSVNSEPKIGPATVITGFPDSLEHPIPAPIDELPIDDEHLVDTGIREAVDQPKSEQPEAKPNGPGDHAELQGLVGHKLEPDGKTDHDPAVGQSPVVPSPSSAEAPQPRRKWGPSRRSWLGIGFGALAIASLAIALLPPSRALHDGHSVTNASNINSTSLATETPTEAAATPIVDSSSTQTTASPVRPIAESPEKPAVEPSSTTVLADARSRADDAGSEMSNIHSTPLAIETPTEAAITPIVEGSSSQTTDSPIRPSAESESPEKPAIDPTSPAVHAEAGSTADNTRSQLARPNREPNSSALSAGTIAPSGETTALSPAAIGPDGRRLSDTEISALIRRGDSLFGLGDIASARLVYERAARGGSGQAALRLGGTFDSSFLLRAGFSGIRGDVALASRWYRVALELGAGDAEALLQSLQNK
jgi:hypothetical protein